MKLLAIICGRPEDGAWVDVTKREPVFHEPELRSASARNEPESDEELTPEQRHMKYDYP